MLSIGGGMTGADIRVQNQILNTFNRLTESGLKLATLKRINKGSDDPAGLIAVEKLNSELRAVQEISEAAERARAVIHVADSGMSQSSSLLHDIHGNVLAAANFATSPAEREALQMEVDAAIDALDRIGQSTSFSGRNLLDGQPLEFYAGSDLSQAETLQLPDVNSGSLGSEEGALYELRSGGRASLDGDLSLATQILHGALTTVLSGHAEAGAFEQFVVDSTQALLDDVTVNLSQGLSQVLDTDVAFESANLVRLEITAGTAMMAARFTNFTRQAAADLLMTHATWRNGNRFLNRSQYS